MMPVNHVQSRVCYVTVLVDTCSRERSASACGSNRMLTAVDLTGTGVTVNKYFLNITYRTFKTLTFKMVN